MMLSQNFIPTIKPNAETDARQLLEALGRALHRYGLASHRIEESLAAVCRRLGIRGEFFATPTAIFASLDIGGQTQTLLLRLEPGEIDLGKLVRLDGVLRRLLSGDLSNGAAIAAVGRIVDAPARFGTALLLLGFLLVSSSAAVFFGGGPRDVAVAATVGLLTGVLSLAFARFAPTARVVETLAALLAGLVASAAGAWLDSTSIYVTTCAGLIVLFPGLSLTVGVNELATRNLAAGTVRLGGALLSFLQIGFGVAVGLRLGTLFFGLPAGGNPVGLPTLWTPLALLLVALALGILFQAAWRDFVWIALAVTLSFGASRLASQYGVEAGAFVGALVTGVASQLRGRIANRPVSVMMIPGMMLIVPGSVGFSSVSSLLSLDTVAGLQLAVTVASVVVAIVTGLLLSAAIIPSRRAI